MRFRTLSAIDQPLRYGVQLILEFRGMIGCTPTSIPETREYLQVFYETEFVLSKLSCMSRIELTWKTAYGNRERRNPDPEYPFQPESWGIGPGNNRSYEFHRGDFPQTIFIEPWRTV